VIKIHDDFLDYDLKDIPKQTFIYYLRAPDKGRRLDIYTQPPIKQGEKN